MLIKYLSSKLCGLRLLVSSDRICMTRHARSLGCFSANNRWKPLRLGIVHKPNFQPHFPLSQQFNNGTEGFTNEAQFEEICNETLDSLTEYFEQLVETCPHLKDADVNFSDGVLTVQFGNPYGTYVINRQTPNHQIWLSSPRSGPKRYDFEHGNWIYKHDGISLHQLLDREIGDVVEHDVDFSQCSYSGTQH